MRHEGMWKCEKVMCPYQVRPDPRSIAAHNALSLKVQRAEPLDTYYSQLEHFAELAVPIVKFAEHYFDEIDHVVERKNSFSKQCTACLAALPEKPSAEEKAKEIHDE
jgi:hypothetical protein